MYEITGSIETILENNFWVITDQENKVDQKVNMETAGFINRLSKAAFRNMCIIPNDIGAICAEYFVALITPQQSFDEYEKTIENLHDKLLDAMTIDLGVEPLNKELSKRIGVFYKQNIPHEKIKT